MPFGDYENFDACVRDNSDKRDPEAYCAEIKRSIEGATLTDAEQKALSRSECPEGHVHVDGECKPVSEVVESAGAPPSVLSSNTAYLTLKSLESEPIERLEEGENTVRYTSVKLLSPGIWADAGSQTETWYPPEGIANLQADYDESEHDGPPLNIMHDLDTDEWKAHEASVAGHIDPDSLDTDDDGNLFGDLVLNTSNGAGQFADENLRSTLENEGTVGFGGPSVEIPARGLEQSHDPQRDMPRVDGGLLTGVGLVMDPASKSVNFAREAARRPIAMANGESGESGKVLTRESDSMSAKTLADPDDVRSDLEQYNVDTSDMSDEDVMEFAEGLHADLMDTLGDDAEMEADEDGENEDGGEMGESEDGEEDDGEEDTEMEADEQGDLEAVQDQVANLSSRLEDLEDAVSQAMTADDVDAELEDAAGNKLADAETVEQLEEAKEDIDRRLQALEDKGETPKTLADHESEFEPTYDNAISDGGSW